VAAAAAVVVVVVAVEDGLALRATIPARADITIYPGPVTGRHTTAGA
jgi:hypothetical protein